MSSPNKNQGNLAGYRIEETAKGKGARILGSGLQNMLIRAANAFFNLKVICPISDGVSVKGQLEADVKIGSLGATITMPPMSIPSSSTGGASVQQFKIVSDGGDYWTCKTWDGTTIGSTEIKVAKPFKLRCSTGSITSETVRGQLQNYSYALTGNYYVRTVTDSGGTTIERDVIIPDAIANDIIYGISFSTATPSTLADVTWLDINADGRAWAEA